MAFMQFIQRALPIVVIVGFVIYGTYLVLNKLFGERK